MSLGAVVSTGSESRSAVLVRTDFFSLLPGPRGSAGACAAAYSRATASSLDLAGTNGVGVMTGWYAGARRWYHTDGCLGGVVQRPGPWWLAL